MKNDRDRKNHTATYIEDIFMPAHPIDPAALTQAVTALAKDGKYQPEGNQTKCNYFVADLAFKYFNYDGLNNKKANLIFDHLVGPNGWTALYNPKSGKDDINQGFIDAETYANQGFLVIAAWQNPAGDGHVAACVPGKRQGSGNWGMDVPMVAQAGQTVFPSGRLSDGFGPDKKAGIIVYVWK